MENLTANELNELCTLLAQVTNLCREYSHIVHLEPVKRIIQIADSNYQKADNVLLERAEAATK